MVHSVVFGGFSGGLAARARRIPAAARFDLRRWLLAQRKMDQSKEQRGSAIETAKRAREIDKVLVWRRYAEKLFEAPMKMGRDFFVDQVVKDYAGKSSTCIS